MARRDEDDADSDDDAGMAPEIATQVADVALDPDRPLLVCDADEVLLQFVAGLEFYLERRGYSLSLESFALTGNIRKHGETEASEPETVRALLRDFFREAMDRLQAVPHAPDALAALSARAQIVIVTNVEPKLRAPRADLLARLGMPYPVIANVGGKGRVVKALGARSGRPMFFIDDIPRNIANVAKHAPDSICIHMVADARLARLIDAAEHAERRIDDWRRARAFLERRLDAHGV